VSFDAEPAEQVRYFGPYLGGMRVRLAVCALKASALAYEFAARVQDEIAALGWVTCPQRVTTMAATNITVSGWSRGMLVQFLVRDGRLCAWTRRTCSLASAADALAATPASWREFTRRNAELDAAMAQPG
jgi:excinuclease ABC subunit C